MGTGRRRSSILAGNDKDRESETYECVSVSLRNLYFFSVYSFL